MKKDKGGVSIIFCVFGVIHHTLKLCHVNYIKAPLFQAFDLTESKDILSDLFSFDCVIAVELLSALSTGIFNFVLVVLVK